MTFLSNLRNVERSSGWVGDHASLGGCDWHGERQPRHKKVGKHRPTSMPNRSKRVLDRSPYFKRNSGGCVIFGWNCALQDISSQASHTSALRLIASGK
jgi:hypothetical protein